MAAVILNTLARSRDPMPGTILSIPLALRLSRKPIAACARYERTRSAGTYGNVEALRRSAYHAVSPGDASFLRTLFRYCCHEDGVVHARVKRAGPAIDSMERLHQRFLVV